MVTLPGRSEGFDFGRIYQFTYKILNLSDAAVPATADWIEQVWLGTDERGRLPNDVANGIWHMKIPVPAGMALGSAV